MAAGKELNNQEILTAVSKRLAQLEQELKTNIPKHVVGTVIANVRQTIILRKDLTTRTY